MLPLNKSSLFRGLPLAALLVGGWALGGCSDNFDPSSKVTSFRLLAVQAEPPELAQAAPPGAPARIHPLPPDKTALTSLVADPSQLADTTKRSTVLYFACTPDPQDLTGSTCTSFSQMRDPAALTEGVTGKASQCGQGSGQGSDPTAGLGVGVVGGTSFSGLEACDASGCRAARIQLNPEVPASVLPPPTYTLPPDLGLQALPAGHPTRTLGVQVVILAFAIDASPEEIVSGPDLCSALAQIPQRLRELQKSRVEIDAVKRVVVRGPDAVDEEPNANPLVSGIRAQDGILPVTTTARQELQILPQLPTESKGQPLTSESLFQVYTKYDSLGQALESAHEEWTFTWFATSGKYEKELTVSEPLKANKWTAPAGTSSDPYPASGRMQFYMVARDSRGGIGWTVSETKVGP